MTYYGQAFQDLFVLHMLNYKTNGFFLEIGSNHPIQINNTYKLEKEYNWRGILVEQDISYLPLYKEHRPNSFPVIQDATLIDYLDILKKTNAPNHIDYLQIDLEENDGSTLKTLQKLDETIMDIYTFGVITFEHDIYRDNVHNTRELSRNIFKRRGYTLLYSDIKNQGNPYEDWYVHSSVYNGIEKNGLEASAAIQDMVNTKH